MDDIKIDTGGKELSVNGDPKRVIRFNPADVLFAERFYRAATEFRSKEVEFRDAYAELDKDGEADPVTGMPSNAEAKLQLIKETCQYFRDKIDAVFGEGTSQAAFGEANTLDMFQQFFDAVSPYVKDTREAKVAKYVAGPRQPTPPRRRRRK